MTKLTPLMIVLTNFVLLNPNEVIFEIVIGKNIYITPKFWPIYHFGPKNDPFSPKNEIFRPLMIYLDQIEPINDIVDHTHVNKLD